MTFKEKKKELMEKYGVELTFISARDDVDLGVAWEKLDSYGRGLAPSPFINKEELAKDCAELLEIAKQES